MTRTRLHTIALCTLATTLGAGCDDALDRRLAIVTEPRVLAITAEPAEARPGAMVRYAALLAGPDGPLPTAPTWAYCTAPKAPTEDNVVSDVCLGDAALVPLGTAATVTGALPADGCLRFGPDVPPGGFRPRAADATGGFYQPVRLVADELLAFGLSRITCKLPAAPADVAHDYEVRYVANANPTLEASGDPVVVSADTDITLTARWPAEAAEPYLAFDPDTQQLVTRREAMRVSWFATGGALAVDASAVGEDDPATSVSTTWHTPARGTVWIWLVLRDARGGIATQARQLTVE